MTTLIEVIDAIVTKVEVFCKLAVLIDCSRNKFDDFKLFLMDAMT